MTALLLFDRADEFPGDWWPPSSGSDPRTTRAWSVACRWAGDGGGFLVESGGGLPAASGGFPEARGERPTFAAVRRVTGHQGWARMNAVDVCAGLARGVEQGSGALAAARAETARQLNLALAGYTTPVWSGDVGPERLAPFVRAVHDAAGAEGASTAVLHMAADAPLAGVLRRMGWTVGVTDLYAVLDDIGGSLDDYLLRRTRSQRSNIRREFRLLERQGGRAELVCGPGLDAVLPEVARLEAAADERHGIVADPARLHRMNERLRREFGADMAVALVRDASGVAVASCTLVRAGRRIMTRLAGLDDRAAVPLGGYFHACYYLPMRWAWETGATEVLLGTGSLTPKLLRGAALRPLVSAVPPDCAALAGLLRRTDAEMRARAEDLRFPVDF